MESHDNRTAVIIDDDPDVRDLLVEILTSSGFDVIEADNGTDGIAAVFAHDPLITTLDVNMPGIDGFETARRIRERSDTYIVMITALADEADAVLAFSVGADDVVVKPFRPRELRARLLAAQRRRRVGEPAAAPASTIPPAAPAGLPSTRSVGWNGLRLSRAAHSVTVDGRPVSLTRIEFDLLAAILESEGEVRTKADLVRVVHAVDGPVRDADERAIETHITNVRRKLGESAADPRFISTIRGVGYRAIVPA